MPGILDLYATHAEEHIENHVKAGTKALISRKQVELEIIDGLDKNKFPIEIKISWYHAILSTPLFETLWRSAAVRHKLSAASINRYQPKDSLLELPTSDDVFVDFGVSFPGGASAHGRKRPQKRTPSKKRATTGLKTIPKPGPSPVSSASVNENEYNDNDNNNDDDDDDDDTSSSTSSTRAYAAALAAELSAQGPVYSSPPQYPDPSDPNHFLPGAHSLIDPNGLARQDDGDGEYGKRGRPRGRGAAGHGSKPKKGSSGKAKGKGKGKEVRFAM